MITASIQSDFEETSSPLLSDDENCLERSKTKAAELSKVTKPNKIKNCICAVPIVCDTMSNK